MSLDFIRDPSKLLLLALESNSSSLRAIVQTAQSMNELQVSAGIKMAPLSRILHTLEKTILVVSISDQGQLNALLPLLQQSDPYQKQGRIKWLALTPRHSNIQDVLLKKGVSETLVEPATTKSFFYKFEKVKLLLGQPGSKSASSSQSEGSAHNLEKESSLHGETPTLRMMPELSMESDFWLIQGGGVKKSGDRWNIKLKGPKPSEGRWLGTKHPEETQDTWKWVMNKAETNPFAEAHGYWVFAGHRTPEYFNDRWWFVGNKPWLKFVTESSKEVIATKFRFDDRGAIHVSRDSKKARDRQPNYQEIWTVPGDSKKKTTESKPRELQRGAPMKVATDPWLFPRGGTHFVQGRWTVKLLGPSPADGGWTALDQERWLWSSKNAQADELVGKGGVWIAWGDEPQFKQNIWIFSGKKPRLAYCNKEHQIVATKFIIQEGNQVQIAAESPQAKQLLGKLKDSLNRHQAAQSATATAPQIIMNEVYRDAIERSQAGLEEAKKNFSFLNLAFQLSEWKRSPQVQLPALSAKICSFLSAQWKGGRVELWQRNLKSDWKNLATSDDDHSSQWNPLDSKPQYKVKRLIAYTDNSPRELGALVFLPVEPAAGSLFDATAEMISEFLKPILEFEG